MKAGRELDGLIAERVMGWVWVVDNTWVGPKDTPFSERRDPKFLLKKRYLWPKKAAEDYDVEPAAMDLPLCRGFDSSVPEYSSSIAAAWEVVERFTYPKVWFDQSSAEWVCEVSKNAALSMKSGQIEKDVFASAAETAPLAICLAALKACGVELPR